MLLRAICSLEKVYASAMAKRKIPAGFPEVINSFARELLREHSVSETPSDSHDWIYRFAKDYFEKGGVVSVSKPKVAIPKVVRPAPTPSASAPAEDAIVPGLAPLPHELTFPSAEELENKIKRIFKSADRDGSGASVGRGAACVDRVITPCSSAGTLDHREFRQVLKQFASDLGLPLADIRQV